MKGPKKGKSIKLKNRYEIVEKIGEGSFATVFKAYDSLNN